MKINAYQKRTIYITTGVLIFFAIISFITNDWRFFLGSLYSVFINIMFAFTAKNNKHIQKFNQKHAEKKKLVK
ncbi:hypothetical protein J18TS1_17060 [Oceanobacillus oncorhynchi subsp. incaldanensis]|uniref:Uncharacterized protein n=2 Tax=Oceanobacillus TaxID=182709 RepID=A0A0A1MQ93_9BACI|nr:hypothetical protein [Oceanobacillus oncorhynchi]MDM8099925.1 hypothetical protein [Oceanobacillus oncorhynchi]GIO18606.1 hypothetical protein J18TS1_17060 [Oceanobacillus oncorhynchi subsp. incaldanensis]CEI81884.1 hypothetical protein BN997_01739 [Oceanobacillus oncorhynchi]